MEAFRQEEIKRRRGDLFPFLPQQLGVTNDRDGPFAGTQNTAGHEFSFQVVVRSCSSLEKQLLGVEP